MTARKNGSNSKGSSFDDATVQAVWNKATPIPGTNANVRRKDVCGAIIDRNKYGDTTENGNGWEIDHIKPVSRNGTDDLSNLQPLQWQNNRAKGDDYPADPGAYCAVKAR